MLHTYPLTSKKLVLLMSHNTTNTENNSTHSQDHYTPANLKQQQQ
jgi:hypothetical protein